LKNSIADDDHEATKLKMKVPDSHEVNVAEQQGWMAAVKDLDEEEDDPHKALREGPMVFNPSTNKYDFLITKRCSENIRPPFFVRMMKGFPGDEYWFELSREASTRCCSEKDYEKCKCPKKNVPWVKRKMKIWCDNIIRYCDIEDPNK
jgi:hypothetical protein